MRYKKKDLLLNLTSPLSFTWIVCLVVALFMGLTAFTYCVKGLKLQGFFLKNPIQTYNDYKQKSEDEIKIFLIETIGDLAEENRDISKTIKDTYKKSLNYLEIAAAVTILLFIYTLFILIGVVMV